MTEIRARKIYLEAVAIAQKASRQACDRRRSRENRAAAYLKYQGLAHVQKIFYEEWMTHFPSRLLNAMTPSELTKKLTSLKSA